MTVQTTSASLTASRADSAARTGSPTSLSIRLANAAARSPERPHTRTRSSDRTSRIDRRWVAACSPYPRRARVRASFRASASVATALAAAVRMAVSSPAWTAQTGAPDSGSKRSTSPWWDCRPRAKFSWNTLSTFEPKGPWAPSAPVIAP